MWMLKGAGMCRRVITLFSFTGKVERVVENASRAFYMENWKEEEELKAKEERRKREKVDLLISQRWPTLSEYSI